MQRRAAARWLLCPVAFAFGHWCLLLDACHGCLLGLCPILWDVSSRKPSDPSRGYVLLAWLIALLVWLVYSYATIVTLRLILSWCPEVCVRRCASAGRATLAAAVQGVHRWGLLETIAYDLAFALVAQGCHMLPARGDGAATSAAGGAALAVSLAGDLAALPCLAYSTRLHAAGEVSRPARSFLLASAFLAPPVLAPLAILHGSLALGSVVAFAAYVALALLLVLPGERPLPDDETTARIARACASASVSLVAGFSTLIAACGLDGMKPFALGAACVGHVGYFAAVLALCSGWVSPPGSWEYLKWQIVMLGSLAAAIVVGSAWSLSGLTGTAYTFLPIWLMEKEAELAKDSVGLKLLGVYLLGRFMDRKHITSMFDPYSLYF